MGQNYIYSDGKYKIIFFKWHLKLISNENEKEKEIAASATACVD